VGGGHGCNCLLWLSIAGCDRIGRSMSSPGAGPVDGGQRLVNARTSPRRRRYASRW
jgi:hypothetical protein